jgi:DNA-directed RNA polymerase subunit L
MGMNDFKDIQIKIFVTFIKILMILFDTMEIKILENKKTKMIVEIHGETHTFCNALKRELRNDKHVKTAGYNIDHPFVGVPKLVVETDSSESPKKALAEATKRLEKTADGLKQAISKL